MKALIYGIIAWMLVEASFSLFYGVYFNVVVVVLLIIFLGFPLVLGIRSKKS